MRHIHLKKGSSLALVLVLISALMLVLSSLTIYSNQDYKITAKVNDSLRAYHLALSGMQTALYHINLNWENRAIIKPNGLFNEATDASSTNRLYFYTTDEDITVGDNEFREITAFGVANDQIIKLTSMFQINQKGPPPEAFAIINYFKFRDQFTDTGYNDPDSGNLVGDGNGVFNFKDSGFTTSTGTTFGSNNKKFDWEDDGFQGNDGDGNPVYNSDLAGNHKFDTGERGETGEMFSTQSTRLEINSSNSDIKSFTYQEPIFTVLDKWTVFGSIYSNSSVSFDTEETEDFDSVCKIIGPEDFNDNVIKDGFYTLPEDFKDTNGNQKYDIGETFDDIIKNNYRDNGEPYTPTFTTTDDGILYQNGVYDFGFIIQDNGWVFNSDDNPDAELNQVLDTTAKEDRDSKSITSADRTTLESTKDSNSFPRFYKDGFANRTQYQRTHSNGVEFKDVKVSQSTLMFNAPYLEPPNLSGVTNGLFKYPKVHQIPNDDSSPLIYDVETCLRAREYDVYIGKDGVKLLLDQTDPYNTSIVNASWLTVGGQLDSNGKRINYENAWASSKYNTAPNSEFDKGQTDKVMQWLLELKRNNPYLIFTIGHSDNDDERSTATRFYRPTFFIEDMTSFFMRRMNAIWTLGFSENNTAKDPINASLKAKNTFPVHYQNANYGDIQERNINLANGTTRTFWTMTGRYFYYDTSISRLNFRKHPNNNPNEANLWNGPTISGPTVRLNDFNDEVWDWNGELANFNDQMIVDIWIHPELNNKIIYIDGNLQIGSTWQKYLRFITGEPYYDYNQNGIRDSDKDSNGNNTTPEPFLDMNNNGIWDNGLTGSDQGSVEPVQVTFVARGNITVADDLYYSKTLAPGFENNVYSSNDFVTFIALHHPDDDVILDRDPSANFEQNYKSTEDMIVVDFNESGFKPFYGSMFSSRQSSGFKRGAGEGSGNIYLGHSGKGTLDTVHGRFYADNYFYANDSASDGNEQLKIFGSFTAGGAVIFSAGDDTKELIFYHDGRYWPFQDRLDIGASFPDDLGWKPYPGAFKREKVSTDEETEIKTLISGLNNAHIL